MLEFHDGRQVRYCIFCFCHNYPDILIKVALHSCMQTNLIPCVAHTVAANQSIKNWIDQHGIRRIEIEPTVIGSGTWIRLDIHSIADRLGLNETHVLYSDCDVLFNQKYFVLQPPIKATAMRPYYHNLDYNAGITIFNLSQYRELFPEFIAACLDNIWRLRHDEDAFNNHFQDHIEVLPTTYNSFAYEQPWFTAAITHFHGLKPHQPVSPDTQEWWNEITKLNIEHWAAYARDHDLWKSG